MPRILNLIVFFLIITSILSCDNGIDPSKWTEPVQGFSGTITFIGKWPPVDSLIDLRVAVYQNYPPKNFFEISKFSDSTLSFNVNSLKYKLFLPPGKYDYIVIAQQYGSNFLLNWRAVGFYSTDLKSSYPSSLIIKENTFIDNINITVDFDHLPIQPFLK